jgi:hypothetical protein
MRFQSTIVHKRQNGVHLRGITCTHRHCTTPTRHLVQTPSSVGVPINSLVNLPLQPQSPQTPLASFLSFAQERKEFKGGSYVLVGQQARGLSVRSWRSVTLPPCRQLVRAIRHTFSSIQPSASPHRARTTNYRLALALHAHARR